MLTLEQSLEKFNKTVADMAKKVKETEDIFKPEKVTDERKLRLKKLYDGPGYDRPNSSLYRGYGSFFLPKLHEKGIIKLDDQIYNNLKEGQHHWGGADFFAPDPIRIWRKHFGNEVFEKLDNFNPDSEDILDWAKRNNIEPVQKDGPKNALEYMTSTEVQQRLADETSSFGKYKNPESAGDDARFYYKDKPEQRMERITYHGENISALEQALQTLDPDSYKEYFRTKPTYDSKVLPFKELNAEGGRVGYRRGGGTDDESDSKKNTPSSTSLDRPTMADVAGPSQRPASIGPVPPPQEIEIKDRPIFDIEERGDPALNPFSQNVEGGLEGYTPSFEEPTLYEEILDTGTNFLNTAYNNPYVRLGLGLFLPTEFQRLQQLIALKNTADRFKKVVTEGDVEAFEELSLPDPGLEEIQRVLKEGGINQTKKSTKDILREFELPAVPSLFSDGGRVNFFKGAQADTKKGKSMSPGTGAGSTPDTDYTGVNPFEDIDTGVGEFDNLGPTVPGGGGDDQNTIPPKKPDDLLTKLKLQNPTDDSPFKKFVAHDQFTDFMKMMGTRNYHQMGGLDFMARFPNTNPNIAKGLATGYQYLTEGVKSLNPFDDYTFTDAMNRAAEESRLNIKGIDDFSDPTSETYKQYYSPNTNLTLQAYQQLPKKDGGRVRFQGGGADIDLGTDVKGNSKKNTARENYITDYASEGIVKGGGPKIGTTEDGEIIYADVKAPLKPTGIASLPPETEESPRTQQQLFQQQSPFNVPKNLPLDVFYLDKIIRDNMNFIKDDMSYYFDPPEEQSLSDLITDDDIFKTYDEKEGFIGPFEKYYTEQYPPIERLPRDIPILDRSFSLESPFSPDTGGLLDVMERSDLGTPSFDIEKILPKEFEV